MTIEPADKSPGPASRACGECTLCCRLMGVAPLNKPPLTRCRHVLPRAGCGIYATRPGACAAFNCYWLTQPALDDAWRPDRSGFVLQVAPNGQMNVEVDPRRPDAWRREPYLSTLRRWAEGGARRGLALKVWVGRRCFAMDGQGPVDLGEQRRPLKDEIGWVLTAGRPVR